MSNTQSTATIVNNAILQLYAVAQQSMTVATLDECADPDLPKIILEYLPKGALPATCLLTVNTNDAQGSQSEEISCSLEEVASAILIGRPLIPQLLQSKGFEDMACQANGRGFSEVCTLESAVVHGYRILLRYDEQPNVINDGPQGYALRVSKPITAEDRKAEWFSISKDAIKNAVIIGESLLKHALLDSPEALRFLSGAIPEVESAVIAAGIGAAAKGPSRSL